MSELLIALAQAALVGSLSILPGLAWLLVLPKWLAHRTALSLLLGTCSFAWLIQVVYLFGGSSQSAVVFAAVIVSLVLGFFAKELPRAIADLKPYWVHFLFFYTVCLLCTSLIVWPAAGPWSTDWVANYMQMEVVQTSQPLGDWLLARPLVFPSLSIPFLPFMEPLFAFQLSICATTAFAMLSVLSYAQSLTSRKIRLLPFAILFCASPFFLVNFTSFVPKLLQATLIVGAFLLMREPTGKHLIGRMAFSSLLFGLAMECHHSTVAYVPALALGWLWVGWPQKTQLLGGIAVAVPIGVLLIMLPELRKISLYGVDEIVKYNPSKAMRSSEPAWVVFLMTLECKAVGYQFLVPPYIWLKDTVNDSAKPLAHYLYWFWFVWLSVLSNTFLFIMLPFLFNRSRIKAYISFVRQHVPIIFFAGAMIAILINCQLNPYYISSGNVHCGSTAIALALVILAIAWISEQSSFIRLSAWVTVALGGLPWIGWESVQFAKVLALGGFQQSGEVLDDNLDLPALLSISQTPWGYPHWPWLPLLLAAGMVGLYIIEKNSFRTIPGDSATSA